MEEKTKAPKENDSTSRVKNYYSETKTLNSYHLGAPKGNDYLTTKDVNNSNGSGFSGLSYCIPLQISLVKINSPQIVLF